MCIHPSLHTVKWFQVFLSNIIHLFAHLIGFNHCYIIIPSNIICLHTVEGLQV